MIPITLEQRLVDIQIESRKADTQLRTLNIFCLAMRGRINCMVAQEVLIKFIGMRSIKARSIFA